MPETRPPVAPPLPPVAWGVLLALAAARVALQLVSSACCAYGYMTDELYYLDSLDRLAWGYVDHPPFSIATLRVFDAVLGHSLVALRLAPALAGAGAIVLSGLLARELGGGRPAQGLAALATFCSPVLLGMTGFYSMNALDLLAWCLAGWLLLRIANTSDGRLWLLLGVVLGLGLLDKFSVAWLAAGMGLGILLTPFRRWLATPWPWAGAAVALALFAPHLVWQVRHDWPFLEFQRNATASKVVPMSPLGFLGLQLLLAGPVAAPLWVGGPLWLLRIGGERPHRLLAWSFLGPLLILLASGGVRAYYLAPAFPFAFAAGGAWVGRLSGTGGRRWLAPALAGALALAGVVSLPFSLPILPPERTLALQQRLGLENPIEERGSRTELPIHLALQLHAEPVLDAAERAWATLTPAERETAAIVTDDFGSAGAISVLGRARGLPRAIGTHNSYWLWGPGDHDGEVLLVFRDRALEEGLREEFAEVERVADIDCPLCMGFLKRHSFFVCRGPRRPLAELWPRWKKYL